MECLFCGIVDGKINANIVYQDASVVAFKDINPQAPVHVLIIPRKHIATVSDLSPGDAPLLSDIFRAADRIAHEHGIANKGFRVLVNCGADAGQTVFHLHYHLLGGRHMKWPPG